MTTYRKFCLRLLEKMLTAIWCHSRKTLRLPKVRITTCALHCPGNWKLKRKHSPLYTASTVILAIKWLSTYFYFQFTRLRLEKDNWFMVSYLTQNLWTKSTNETYLFIRLRVLNLDEKIQHAYNLDSAQNKNHFNYTLFLTFEDKNLTNYPEIHILASLIHHL